MASLAERLATLPQSERDAALATLTDEEAEALLYDWRGFLARPDQIAPGGDWDIWLFLAGRGAGKTRAGAEWVREMVDTGQSKRPVIVAETAADARDVMVAELMRVYPPSQRPEYFTTKRMVRFHNGVEALIFNATEPDQLRGPQSDCAWCDELAKWRYAQETWDNLQFGLRLGAHPRVLVTTTPRPIEIIKNIVAQKEGRAAITKGRTLDNKAHLSAQFVERIHRRHAGTRLGRQELEAEILSDLPGALWRQADIDAYRHQRKPDQLGRTVVAVDPAVTATEESDENGIIVAARTGDGEAVILADESTRGSPAEWAQRVVAVFDEYGADAVVAEVNQGGDMVTHTLRTVRPHLPVVQVRASRGKHIRAQPVSSLYQQGRIRHVGQMPELENQMTQMTTEGYQGSGSPDRVDALVWAISELLPDLELPIKPSEPPKYAGRGWLAS